MKFIHIFILRRGHFKHFAPLPPKIVDLIFLLLWFSSENHKKTMVREPSLKFTRFTFKNQNQGDSWEEVYNFCSNRPTHYFFSSCSENRLSTWPKLKPSKRGSVFFRDRTCVPFITIDFLFPLVLWRGMSLHRHFVSWGRRLSVSLTPAVAIDIHQYI